MQRIFESNGIVHRKQWKILNRMASSIEGSGKLFLNRTASSVARSGKLNRMAASIEYNGKIESNGSVHRGR